ncbi:MAG: hypothetical protein PHY91_07945 [Tissierellia bacterium]|nr:hypothetical protein [Tissierellia bacterium]MDD4726810.1 hypothetical protein [Tissierellia bacterium]
MNNKLYKAIKITLGLFVFAVGIVMTINANLGLAPWDVFHEGMSKTIGITMGMAIIISGFVIVLIDVAFGQNIGWATLMDMVLTGTFVDIIMINNLIPSFTDIIPRLIMLLLGLFIEGIAVWIYISVGLGAGPKDGLMVVLTKKTGKSVRVVKSSIEVLAVTTGYLLGGSIGIGTLIMALMSGQIWQIAFNIVKFDINKIDHRFIMDDIALIKKKNSSNK